MLLFLLSLKFRGHNVTRHTVGRMISSDPRSDAGRAPGTGVRFVELLWDLPVPKRRLVEMAGMLSYQRMAAAVPAGSWSRHGVSAPGGLEVYLESKTTPNSESWVGCLESLILYFPLGN